MRIFCTVFPCLIDVAYIPHHDVLQIFFSEMVINWPHVLTICEYLQFYLFSILILISCSCGGFSSKSTSLVPANLRSRFQMPSFKIPKKQPAPVSTPIPVPVQSASGCDGAVPAPVPAPAEGITSPIRSAQPASPPLASNALVSDCEPSGLTGEVQGAQGSDGVQSTPAPAALAGSSTVPNNHHGVLSAKQEERVPTTVGGICRSWMPGPAVSEENRRVRSRGEHRDGLGDVDGCTGGGRSGRGARDHDRSAAEPTGGTNNCGRSLGGGWGRREEDEARGREGYRERGSGPRSSEPDQPDRGPNRDWEYDRRAERDRSCRNFGRRSWERTRGADPPLRPGQERSSGRDRDRSRGRDRGRDRDNGRERDHFRGGDRGYRGGRSRSRERRGRHEDGRIPESVKHSPPSPAACAPADATTKAVGDDAPGEGTGAGSGVTDKGSAEDSDEGGVASVASKRFGEQKSAASSVSRGRVDSVSCEGDEAPGEGEGEEASRGGDGRVEQDGGAGGGCSEAEGVQHGNGGKTREEACKGDEVDGEQGMAAATGKNRAQSRPDSANGPGDCHEGSASGDSHDRDGSHGHGRGPMRREQVGDSGRVERSRSAGRFGGGDRWRERRRSRERGWGDRRTSWEAESRGNWRSLTTQVPLLRTLSARFLQSTFPCFLHLLRFPSIHLSLRTG